MSVWFCIPSKKPAPAAQQCIDAWRGMGYRVAIWRDIGDAPVKADLIAWGQYQGYAHANNHLASEVMHADANAEWLVFGGDDIWPDLRHSPFDLEQEIKGYFGWSTFGVMQPTGDRWGENPTMPNLHPMRTAYIDRVLGSPWMGREYCERMYGGRGPWCEEYSHMFVDEEAFEVAKSLGVLWQRRDLNQEHKHWAREKRAMPAYLQGVNSSAHWQKSKAIFENRKASGFPGHEPIPVPVCA